MKSKRSLAVVCCLAMVLMLGGCGLLPIQDDANSQAVAYISGKAVGAAVNQYAPKADGPLGVAWGDMMVANNGADPVPVESIMAFYGQAVVLIGQQSKDPYGLLSDLTMLLSIYGGSLIYDATGGIRLELVKPIPLSVMKAFELGYKSGKAAVSNYVKK